MDAEARKISQAVGEKLSLIGGAKELEGMDGAELEGRIFDEPFKAAYGAYGAMNEAESVPNASKRFTRVPVDVEEKGEAKDF